MTLSPADLGIVGIKLEEHGAIAVIAPERDFVGPDVLSARRAVTDWLDAGTVTRFVFDLSNAGFVDSEGLEALTFAATRSQQVGGRVVLAGPDDNCRKILEMTRLDRRFELFPDSASALKALRRGDGQ